MTQWWLICYIFVIGAINPDPVKYHFKGPYISKQMCEMVGRKVEKDYSSQKFDDSEIEDRDILNMDEFDDEDDDIAVVAQIKTKCTTTPPPEKFCVKCEK